MSSDPLADALAQLLVAYSTDHKTGADLGAKLLKKKELKDGLAPIAKLFKYGGARREIVLERCLELPVDHPLHRAGAALVASGTIPWTPWVSICTSPQPKRGTRELVVSRHSPVVYAREDAPRIAIWSLVTGAHEGDLAVPVRKDIAVCALVELPEGTLRCVSEDGSVCERALGAKAFTKVLDLGLLRHGWAASADLRFHVTQVRFEPIETGSAHAQAIALHDVVTRTSKEIHIPASHTSSGFVRVDGKVAIACRRALGAAPQSHEAHAVVLVDLVTGAIEEIPFDATIDAIAKGSRAGVVRVSLSQDDASGQPACEQIELDVATRERRPAPLDATDPGWQLVRMSAGRAYDPQAGAIRDETGAEIGVCGIDGAWRTFGVWDDARGQLVLAGNDPAVPVTVIAPYDAARATGAPVAVEIETLSWARPGTLLTYEISGDADRTTWSFEVLSASSGLVLAIREGDAIVAAEARFGEKALEDASAFVALSRGAADVDLTKEQVTRVPPIVLGRASARKLASGKTVPFRSEWTEKTTLDPANAGPVRITVDRAEHAVMALRATSAEGVSLTWLADAQWPLVIERREGERSVRLVSIEASRATSEQASEKGEHDPASAPAPRSKSKKGYAEA